MGARAGRTRHSPHHTPDTDTMKDSLRSKLNVTLAATVAFAAGLLLAAQLDLAPAGMAAVQSADLQLGASEDQVERLQDMTFRDGFSEVVDQVSQAVVTIRVEKEVEGRMIRPDDVLPFPPFRREQPDREQPPTRPGSGSGFIVSDGGYIVTNNHVVSGATNITIQLSDRREIDDVEIVGNDPQTDVALLRIDASDLQAVPLGTSDDLRVGDWALAIGSPGFDAGGTILESTVTAGIVSAKGRSIGILGRQFVDQNVPNLAIENFIQTDAVINRGNSGGPLVNVRGEVVGMNTAILSETGNYEGYGFAVPSELIRQVVEDLMEYGEVQRAVLGISINPVDPATARYFGLDEVRGVVVADFSPLAGGASPARQAGLVRGDIILAVDGEPVTGIPDLQSRIRTYDPGESVTLSVARDEDGETRYLDIDVELGAAETGSEEQERQTAAADAEDPFGIGVEPVTSRMRQELSLPDDVEGVFVSDVDRQSPLFTAAPAWGRFTFITRIDGRTITDMESYREAIADLEPGSVTRVQLYLASPQGQGRYVFATVEVPRS